LSLDLRCGRAAVASTISTAIEWYDFFLYSTVTGLVFAKLFFPGSDPWVGTLEAFAIYAVGFVARPIGAAIFGHYGDRIGRKSTLIATLMLMGLATFAVALVPTYETIGIWGAVILTILRFIQGIGVGGDAEAVRKRIRKTCSGNSSSVIHSDGSYEPVHFLR
jgi:MFS family permease